MDEQKSQPHRAERGRTRTVAVIVAFATVAAIGVGALTWQLVTRNGGGSRLIEVPHVDEMRVRPGLKLVVAAGLRVAVPDPIRLRSYLGHISGQSPAPGARVARGSVVTLTLSVGPGRSPGPTPRQRFVEVPRVVGLRLGDGLSNLDEKRLGWSLYTPPLPPTSNPDPLNDYRIVRQNIPAGRGALVPGAVVLLDTVLATPA